MNGFLNLLKPPGMTSSDAVVQIRRTLSGEKVGHAGTLDPEAAGVLPIMIGKASRLFDVLTEKQKAYVAEIAFGVATDTQDAQGRVLERANVVPGEDAIRRVLPQFTGEILQVPPAYSALKVQGKPAYALAREGRTAQLAARPARIDAIDFLGFTGPDTARLYVVCGKGVYIRTLCHDIGRALDCPAHMRFLLRTRSGSFSLAGSVTLEEWLGHRDRAALLTPMDAPLAHLPAVRVPESLAPKVRNGNPIASFESVDEAAYQGGIARVYCGGVFAGIGRLQGGTLHFQAVLMESV